MYISRNMLYFSQDMIISLISQFSYRDGFINVISLSLIYKTELYLKVFPYIIEK